MRTQMDMELLNRLLGDIERGWRDRQDRTVAYRLAETHPDYREELLEFFDDLVVGPRSDAPADLEEAEQRVSDWIESNGIAAAIAAAVRAREGGSTKTTAPLVSPQRDVGVADAADDSSSEANTESKTFLLFLKQRLNRRTAELAAQLPHVTTEYLVLASRHPNLLPNRVCKVLAQSVEDQWRVSAAESMRYLEGKPAITRAASRATSFEKEPSSFRELLDRASLTPEQKAFWLGLVEGA